MDNQNQGQMANPDFWRTEQSRQSVRAKIDAVISQMPTVINGNGTDIERKIFEKTVSGTNTKETYLSLVQSLFSTLRQKKQTQDQVRQQQQQQQQQQGAVPQPNPMMQNQMQPNIGGMPPQQQQQQPNDE